MYAGLQDSFNLVLLSYFLSLCLPFTVSLLRLSIMKVDSASCCLAGEMIGFGTEAWAERRTQLFFWGGQRWDGCWMVGSDLGHNYGEQQGCRVIRINIPTSKLMD